jgi:hypothetical protein
MLKFARSLVPSVLAGAVVGFIVLGIGGRVMMRIIAHWEGRVPVLTSGTLTVLMMGTIAGVAAGIIHGVLLRFIVRTPIRVAAFVAICVLFTLRGVSGLLPRPKLLFIGITLVYAIAVELVTQRRMRKPLPPPAASQSPQSVPSPRAAG